MRWFAAACVLQALTCAEAQLQTDAMNEQPGWPDGTYVAPYNLAATLSVMSSVQGTVPANEWFRLRVLAWADGSVEPAGTRQQHKDTGYLLYDPEEQPWNLPDTWPALVTSQVDFADDNVGVGDYETQWKAKVRHAYKIGGADWVEDFDFFDPAPPAEWNTGEYHVIQEGEGGEGLT